jgi:hypothetical protein
MVHGPVEVLVVAFPGNRFSGTIVPELAKVVENGTITVIDGLFIRSDEAGDVSFVELEEVSAAEGDASLAGLVQRTEGLISDEDVAELTADLEPNSSAAILVFEHTWALPLRDAIAASGGVLLEDIGVPGPVADEVFDAVSELDDERG